MLYFLLLTLWGTPSALATTDHPTDHLTGEQICQVVDLELQEAVEFELITEKEAGEILLRCLINYS